MGPAEYIELGPAACVRPLARRRLDLRVVGVLHGTYLAMNTLFDRLAGTQLEQHRVLNAALTAASLPLTYLEVNYAWIYFWLPTLDQALLANRKILEFLLHPQLPNTPLGIAAIFAAVLVMDLVTRG